VCICICDLLQVASVACYHPACTARLANRVPLRLLAAPFVRRTCLGRMCQVDDLSFHAGLFLRAGYIVLPKPVAWLFTICQRPSPKSGSESSILERHASSAWQLVKRYEYSFTLLLAGVALLIEPGIAQKWLVLRRVWVGCDAPPLVTLGLVQHLGPPLL
jgi:hypothetical protein